MVADLLERYGETLLDAAGWWVLAAAAATIVTRPVVRRRLATLPPRAWTVAAVAIAILAVAWAWHLRWISDDAFISFRYSRNWARGDGLVFNAGERVEGYTNFLWTAILTLTALVGLDIPATALALDLATFVGVLWIVQRLAVRLAPDDVPVRISFAAVACACSYTLASFATSGLETMPATLLVLVALERALAGRIGVAGCAGIAATLMHPDHAIFYVALGGVLAARRTPVRQLARYAAPFVLGYVPYYLVRWAYYGDFFPNTYYAKSGGDAYFHQGAIYLGASALAAGLWAALPLGVVGLVQLRRSIAGAFGLVVVPLYLVYVAKIGGDYMLGRLVCAALPLVFLGAEHAIRSWLARGWSWRAGGALALAAVACVPVHLLRAGEITWYLTDERTFYPVESVMPLELGGTTPRRVAALERNLGTVEPPLAYAAWAIGLVGWELDGPILDMHGLVDRELAHQPLARRDRPGHERQATPAYVLAHDLDLSGMSVHPARYAPLTRVVLDRETFYVVHYRPAVFEALRGRPGAHYVDFLDYLDRYLVGLADRDCKQLAGDLAFFDSYYFARNRDDVRRRPLDDRRRACERNLAAQR
jgi:hypothetical protein